MRLHLTGQSGWFSRIFKYASVKASTLSADARSRSSAKGKMRLSTFCFGKKRPVMNKYRIMWKNTKQPVLTTSMKKNQKLVTFSFGVDINTHSRRNYFPEKLAKHVLIHFKPLQSFLLDVSFL